MGLGPVAFDKLPQFGQLTRKDLAKSAAKRLVELVEIVKFSNAEAADGWGCREEAWEGPGLFSWGFSFLGVWGG